MNLFPTSVVGSLPRPAFVLDILANRDGLSSAEFEQRMQAAIGYAVVMQEQAGLDVLTDASGGGNPTSESFPNLPMGSNWAPSPMGALLQSLSIS